MWSLLENTSRPYPKPITRVLAGTEVMERFATRPITSIDIFQRSEEGLAQTIERLLQVVDQVALIFDADAQTHQSARHFKG